MFNYILNYSKINFTNFYFLLILVFLPYFNFFLPYFNFFYFFIFFIFLFLKFNYQIFNTFYLKLNFFFYLKLNFFFYLKLNLTNFFFLFLNFFKIFNNLKFNYVWNPIIKQYSYYGYFKSNTNLWNTNYSEEFKKIKF